MNTFPKKTFKGLAGAQIAIGLFCILIGIVDLSTTIQICTECEMGGERFEDDPKHWGARDDDDSKEKHWMQRKGERPDDMDWGEERPEISPGLRRSIECEEPMILMPSWYAAGIWIGLLMVISGSLGVSAARTPLAHRQSGLKIGFMVMNILLPIMFLPLLFAIGSAEALLASGLFHEDIYLSGKQKARTVFGSFLAIMAFIQFVMSIVNASVSCCCAPTTEVQVMTVAPPMYVYQQPTLQVTDKVPLVDNEVVPEKDEQKC